jgi:hypothetical protein
MPKEDARIHAQGRRSGIAAHIDSTGNGSSSARRVVPCLVLILTAYRHHLIAAALLPRVMEILDHRRGEVLATRNASRR